MHKKADKKPEVEGELEIRSDFHVPSIDAVPFKSGPTMSNVTVFKVCKEQEVRGDLANFPRNEVCAIFVAVGPQHKHTPQNIKGTLQITMSCN